jgi:hypothetical protein
MAWTQLDRPGGAIRLLVAERPPGRAFGDPVPLQSADAALAAVTMADSGDGLAAWQVGTSGPFELRVRGFDAVAPALSSVTIPASAAVGAPAAFAASSFDAWGPLTTTWSFGDGSSATGAAVAHAYARAGSFAATVTVTDAVGNAASRTGTVRVTTTTTAAATAPRLTGASLTHRTFRVGRRPTPLRGTIARRRRHAVPVGTTFRFTLDRAANVRIGFARRTLGVRDRAGDCVRRTRRLAGRRRCTLYVPDGTLVRSARQGAVAIPFSGRVGRRALAPGRYRAGLTAAVGGRSAKPVVLSFRVVR